MLLKEDQRTLDDGTWCLFLSHSDIGSMATPRIQTRLTQISIERKLNEQIRELCEVGGCCFESRDWKANKDGLYFLAGEQTPQRENRRPN